MSGDGLSRSFDPRKHSAVAISCIERLPTYGNARGEEVYLKHFVVGPNVPPTGLSLRRTGTAPTGTLYRARPDGTMDPKPKLLNQNGTWVQEEVPTLISRSQAQPLTATITQTARLQGGREQRAIRPVAALHSYNDVSPVVQADMVRETDTEASLVKETITQRPRAAVSGALHSTQNAANVPTVESIQLRAATRTGKMGTCVGGAEVRSNSIDAFWARQVGTAFTLGISDLERAKELGKNVAPGSANTRLIGGRWRYIDRPIEGDAVYTDYYGRLGGGPQLDDYYGRVYHVQPQQFTKNRLVGDLDYQKIQASMPGIQSLRTRPGLALDTAIVHGAQDKLQSLTAIYARNARGMHKLKEFSRMQPASERRLREVWVDK